MPPMLRLVLNDGTDIRRTLMARKAQTAGELINRMRIHLDENAGRFAGVVVSRISAETSDDNGATWSRVFDATIDQLAKVDELSRVGNAAELERMAGLPPIE